MTPRIHTAGQDNWLGRRPPISDADRIARHGPIQPMVEAPVFTVRDFIVGVAVCLVLCGVGFVLAVML